MLTTHKKNISHHGPFTKKASDGLILWYNLHNGKRDMRFCTWNVRSLYRSGSLTTAARELARYKLDLVGIRGLVIKFPD